MEGNENLQAVTAGSIMELNSTTMTDVQSLRPPNALEFQWSNLALAGVLCIVIVITIIGNTLVILAVITTRRLRTVTNCFVTSLAIADWLVGIFVMPPAVAVYLMGTWELGWILCDIWISLDVLLCTASILSLCAISVDRYLAVTQPLNYSRRRRSKRLALLMILIVWLAAAAITCPPIFGWYEPGRHEGKTCRYNQNEGYVVFSAMGSFFLPMIVMIYVYVRISCVIARRHNQLSNIETHTSMKKQKLLMREESDVDKGCSEYDDTKTAARHSSGASNEPHTVGGFNHAKSLRVNHNNTMFTFNELPKTTSTTPPQRQVTAVYNSVAGTSHVNRSRPESLNLDAATLTYEPSNRVSSFRRETKTAQTLSIVVGGFIACWLPFFIYYLITPFVARTSFSPTLMTFLTWLGWINSAINPFIYAFYSPDFRIAFWRLTFKHCSNNHRTDFAFQNK